MSSTNFRQLYRDAYDSNVPELRRLHGIAWDADHEWMTRWTQRRKARFDGDPVKLVGATPEQIRQVEQMFGRPLPASYRAYLEVMGQYGGMSNHHFVMWFPWPLRIHNEFAPEYVDELRARGHLDQSDLELPEGAVFIGNHEGYDYLFLLDDGEDDPPIWSVYGPSGIFEHVRDGKPVRFSDNVLAGIGASVQSARNAWRVRGERQPLPANWQHFWNQWLRGQKVVGLEPEKVSEVASGQGVDVLPGVYEWFLRFAGSECEALWPESDMAYPKAIGLKRDAKAMLASSGAEVELLDEDIVVRVTPGTEFAILRGADPNPAVWQFVLGATGLTQISATFTEFVIDELSSGPAD